MEQLSGRDFDGVLEHIAQDVEGNIGIRMICTSQTLLYSDEDDDDYERKETKPVNKKLYLIIHQGQLEWGDALLCKPGDKISVRRWEVKKDSDDEIINKNYHYGLTNETLEKGEYVWLNNID